MKSDEFVGRHRNLSDMLEKRFQDQHNLEALCRSKENLLNGYRLDKEEFGIIIEALSCFYNEEIKKLSEEMSELHKGFKYE